MPSLSDAATVHGLAASRRRADEIDARIAAAIGPKGAELFAAGDIALVAVGSYGRRELSPFSDVDVLLLHRMRDAGRVEAATKTLLYPLWDEGFELGYAVRTVGECIKWAKSDPIIATTLHDTRLVDGDEQLVAELATDLARWLKKKGPALQKALLESLAERHARNGDAGVDIEPQIKEGRGGLRDLQTLRWLDPAHSLESDLDTLLAVRNALHEAASGKCDRLVRAHTDEVAARLGLDGAGEATGDPRDALMRAIFDVCRRVGATLGWIRRERLQPVKRYRAPAGFAVESGRLGRIVSTPPEADALAGLTAARSSERIAPAASLLGWAESGSGPIPWSEETREATEALLADASASAWEFLDVTGLWTRYFPELESARAKTQHNSLHQLCVDAHCWETLSEARRLATGDGLTARVAAEFGRPAVLHLAAILHDTGKGLPGDHSREGVIIARRILARMGYGANVEELVAFSIANHLLLPEFATTRDLNDEELVTNLATRIGGIDRLRVLYLLTVADSRATGPAAWSDWKASLLDELYLKCARVLEAGDLTAREARNKVERTRSETVRRLQEAGQTSAIAETMIDAFPRRYLLLHEPEAIVAHVPFIDEVAGNRSAVRIHQDGNQLAVVAHDRPGLLAHVSGALAVRGVNVLTADIYTRADRVAVDVMTVAGDDNGQLGTGNWARVESDVAGAGEDASDLDAHVRDRATRYDDQALGEAEVAVAIDNTSSDWYSVVDVRSKDRVGLLYDIAMVLADVGLSVHFAKVLTQAGQAHDSFSVRDATGAKLDEPAAVAALVRARLLDRMKTSKAAP